MCRREMTFPISTSALMEGICCPFTTLRAMASMEDRNSAGFTPVFRKASRQERMRGCSAGFPSPRVSLRDASASRNRATSSSGEGPFRPSRSTTTPRTYSGKEEKTSSEIV